MRLILQAQRKGKAPGAGHRSSRWARQTATLLAAVALSSCAVTTSQPMTPGVAVPASWQPPDATVGVSVSGGTQDLSTWWRQFDDATLSALIENALAANPEVRGARARLRQARARRGLTGKDLLPTVNGSLSTSGSKAGGDGGGAARTLFDAALDASWEPDIFGGTRQSISAAQADMEASEADLHDTHVSLVAELALNYVDLRAYQARLTIATDNLARQSETLQLTSWRAQAGLVSDLDVEQSRTNVEQTRALIPALETGLAQAEHHLAILTGQAPAALHDALAAPTSIPSIPDRVVIGIPADTLRQRPDVRSAERRLVAEAARLGKAEAARFPSLRLSGTLGAQVLKTGGLAAAEEIAGSLLASLTAPIFDRGRIRQQIEIQGAIEEEALAAFERTILTALEDVENALAALAGSRRRRTSLTSAADAARIAAQLARNRYTAGLVSYQTVLDTERSVLSVEDSLKSTEAEGTSALVRLYKALGGGWTTAQAADTGARPRSEAS
jgi:outer membrane protein, multidrug efflux system